MGYASPADVAITDDFQDHLNRGSAEPGTDYATAYGVNLRMAGAGVVSVVDRSNGGGEGRRLSIDLDDGRRVSYIHLASINADVGMRVVRGQTGVCLSGASGNGSDHWYGAHVHVSLWERPGMAYRDTINFEHYLGGDTPPPPTHTGAKDDDMYLVWYGDNGPAEGWLVNGNAQVGVSSEADYAILKRMIVSDQTAAHPVGFNYAERDVISRYLEALAIQAGKSAAVAPSGASALVTPAWLAGFALGLIGLVEVVRFVVDLLV